MVVPNLLEQHGARHHFACVTREIFEQTEFARLKSYLDPTAFYRARDEIELKIRDSERGLFGEPARATRQRVDARNKLRECERLHEIVIAAGIEPHDAIVHAGHRREKQ